MTKKRSGPVIPLPGNYPQLRLEVRQAVHAMYVESGKVEKKELKTKFLVKYLSSGRYIRQLIDSYTGLVQQRDRKAAEMQASPLEPSIRDNTAGNLKPSLESRISKGIAVPAENIKHAILQGL
ncbi:hypothetical protein BDV25DRAFT_144896 [Aspergillus avenaceus]|uniref:Uncharacterized protein n=1 Tax=Aspergillus avenaceus TaxID=36643 RepID=A0A5N6TFM5_ASPAV|nr:hypothetical protein BDV25DRAFT_144896 [Aspergillus avenaceus]